MAGNSATCYVRFDRSGTLWRKSNSVTNVKKIKHGFPLFQNNVNGVYLYFYVERNKFKYISKYTSNFLFVGANLKKSFPFSPKIENFGMLLEEELLTKNCGIKWKTKINADASESFIFSLVTIIQFLFWFCTDGTVQNHANYISRFNSPSKHFGWVILANLCSIWPASVKTTISHQFGKCHPLGTVAGSFSEKIVWVGGVGRNVAGPVTADVTP
jgi:hypothetical protein